MPNIETPEFGPSPDLGAAVRMDSEKSARDPRKDFNVSKHFNTASILLNCISVLANLKGFFTARKSGDENSQTRIQKFATSLGALGSKALYTVNGLQNAYLRSLDKDYVTAISCASDVPVGIASSQNDLYLWRAISVGSYVFMNGLKDAVMKKEFSSWKENFAAMWEGFKVSLSHCTKGFNHFVEKFMDSNNGLQSVIAGASILSSLPIWWITGSKYLANWIRDLGGVLQDFAQTKPKYMLTEEERNDKNLLFGSRMQIAFKRSKDFLLGKKDNPAPRPFFFNSGISFIVGTLCDYLKASLEWLKSPIALRQIFTSLTYIFDGIGVYLLGRSQEEEIGNPELVGV